MEQPIRVLHVLGRLDRGGAETMVMNLYRNIDRTKVQFDFVIHTNDECDYNQEIIYLGGRIHHVPRYTGTNHFIYIKAWQTLLTNHPEYRIIHGHMRSTASIYLRIAKSYGLITIVHSHSTSSRGNFLQKSIKNLLQLPIRKISDHFFACSKDAGKWLFGKKIVKQKKFHIIKNAIDIDEFEYNETKRAEIRKSYNLENKVVLGHVGNFTPPKNHKFLLDVFLKVQKVNKNTILLLVGDGELRDQIQKKAISLGINERLIMVGSKSKVSDYLHAMDVFIFPSLFEGLGLAVIEAQASGLPCLISKNIPNEVVITKLVKKIPLTSSELWSEYILRSNFKRKNYKNSIQESGYDIKKQVEEITNHYFRMLV